jgi:hypothetical protein
MELNNIAINHDLEHQMFFVRLQNGAAHLKYDKPEENVMKITETYVPKAFRDYGLAGHLVKHVLELARARNKNVIPDCPFAHNYIQKHPQYEDMVVK